MKHSSLFSAEYQMRFRSREDGVAPVFSFSINVFSMSHALDFYNFCVVEKLVHNAIIADSNSVGPLAAAQFLRATGQWIVSELLYFGDNARYCLAGNSAQILSR